MEKLSNEIVLTKDTWKENLAQKIGDIILTLLAEEEVCKIYAEDNNVFIIQHGHDESISYWGCPTLMWLTDEECEKIEGMRNGITDDTDKNNGN